jgi:hypothetical protein
VKKGNTWEKQNFRNPSENFAYQWHFCNYVLLLPRTARGKSPPKIGEQCYALAKFPDEIWKFCFSRVLPKIVLLYRYKKIKTDSSKKKKEKKKEGPIIVHNNFAKEIEKKNALTLNPMDKSTVRPRNTRFCQKKNKYSDLSVPSID